MPAPEQTTGYNHVTSCLNAVRRTRLDGNRSWPNIWLPSCKLQTLIKNLFISLYPQESVFIHFPTVTLRSPSSVTLPTMSSSSLPGFRLPYWASTLSSSIEWQCNNSSEELMLANLNFWSGKISCAENRRNTTCNIEESNLWWVWWWKKRSTGRLLACWTQSGSCLDHVSTIWDLKRWWILVCNKLEDFGENHGLLGLLDVPCECSWKLFASI